MSKNANFSRMLLAIDGSDVSMKAADAAIVLAKKNNAKLLVISAIDPAFGGPWLTDLGDYSKYVKKKQERRLKNGLKKSDKMEGKTKLE